MPKKDTSTSRMINHNGITRESLVVPTELTLKALNPDHFEVLAVLNLLHLRLSVRVIAHVSRVCTCACQVCACAVRKHACLVKGEDNSAILCLRPKPQIEPPTLIAQNMKL